MVSAIKLTITMYTVLINYVSQVRGKLETPNDVRSSRPIDE